MPIIKDFSTFLEKEVNKTSTGYEYKLGLSVIPQVQRGQVCKLNALSVVLNSLHQVHNMPKPLPIRKNSSNDYSLRQLAKERYGSMIGEIYSATTLAKIAADNGYEHSTIVTAKDFQDYTRTILVSINAGEAPILFYDIDLQGDPAQVESNREHAVVVVGFFLNKNRELGFIVSQWGGYYWAKAEDIYLSTNQLNPNRTPEVFYKYNDGWYDLYNTRYYSPSLFSMSPLERRQASPLPPEDGGLKNKVLIIHNQPKVVLKNSFWSSAPLGLSSSESEQLFTQYLIREHIPYDNKPGQ